MVRKEKELFQEVELEDCRQPRTKTLKRQTEEYKT